MYQNQKSVIGNRNHNHNRTESSQRRHTTDKQSPDAILGWERLRHNNEDQCSVCTCDEEKVVCTSSFLDHNIDKRVITCKDNSVEE